MNYEKKIWFGTLAGAFVPFIIYLFISKGIGDLVVTFIWLAIMTVYFIRTDIKLIEDDRLKDKYLVKQLNKKPFITTLVNMLLTSITWIVFDYFVL
jgi:hypothetical protein